MVTTHAQLLNQIITFKPPFKKVSAPPNGNFFEMKRKKYKSVKQRIHSVSVVIFRRELCYDDKAVEKHIFDEILKNLINRAR